MRKDLSKRESMSVEEATVSNNVGVAAIVECSKKVHAYAGS